MLSSLPTRLNSPASGLADAPGVATTRVAGEAGTGFAALMQQHTDLRLANQRQIDRRLADQTVSLPQDNGPARSTTPVPRQQETTPPTPHAPEAAAAPATQAAPLAAGPAHTDARPAPRDDNRGATGTSANANANANANTDTDTDTTDGVTPSIDPPPGQRLANAAALARSRALLHSGAKGMSDAMLSVNTAAAGTGTAIGADDPQATDLAADPNAAAGTLPTWLHAQALMAGWPPQATPPANGTDPAANPAGAAAEGQSPLQRQVTALAEPVAGRADAADRATAFGAATGRARASTTAGVLPDPAAMAALAAAPARASPPGLASADPTGQSTVTQANPASPDTLSAGAPPSGLAARTAQVGNLPPGRSNAANGRVAAGAPTAEDGLPTSGATAAARADGPTAHAASGRPAVGQATAAPDTVVTAVTNSQPASLAATQTAATATADAGQASRTAAGAPAGRTAQRAAGLERPAPGGVASVTGRAVEISNTTTATVDTTEAGATAADEPRSDRAGTAPHATSAPADTALASLAGGSAANAARPDPAAAVHQPSPTSAVPSDHADASALPGLAVAGAGLAAAAHSAQRESRPAPASADALRVADGGTTALAMPAAASGSAPTGVVGSNPAAAPAAPVTEARIPVPLDSPAFAPALGTQISLFARDGVQTARLQLNPAEMGPITVQIAVDGNAARVDFQADFAATRNVIEASLPALAGAMQDAGLTLTGGGVFQQPPGSQAQPEHQRGGQPTAQAGRQPGGTDVRPATPPATARSRGLVDLVA